MKPQKIIPVYQYPQVYQTSIRTVFAHFNLLYDENIIEFYSANRKELIKMITHVFCLESNQRKEIVEVGKEPIFQESQFFSTEKMAEAIELPYGQLSDLRNIDAQVIIVQTKELLEKQNIALLSNLATNAGDLKVLLFLTEATEPEVLPIFNFAQIETHPMINIIEYKKHVKENVSLIEKINDFLLFNLMI